MRKGRPPTFTGLVNDISTISVYDAAVSSVGSVNPTTSLLQDALDQARLHGGHGGGRKRGVKQVANEEQPTAQKAQQTQRPTFRALMATPTTEDPAKAEDDEDMPEHGDERQHGDATAQHHQQQASAEDEPAEEDLETAAAQILDELRAMNPAAF